MNDTDSEMGGSGRQGPRSPLRNSVGRSTLNFSNTFDSTKFGGLSEIGEGNDDNDSENDTVDDTAIDEQYEDLLAINQPLHIYPLSFLRVPRNVEDNAQPLLVSSSSSLVDSASLIPGNIFRKLTSGVTVSQVRNPAEIDVINGGWQSNVHGSNVIHKSKDSAELQSLLSNSESVSGLNQATDGLYVDANPILTDILISAENVTRQLSSMVSSSVDLSRVTQRTLREIQLNIKKDNVKVNTNGSNTDDNGESNRDDKNDENIDTRGNTTSISKANVSGASLLRQINATPVFHVIDNPVVDYPTQPIFPIASIEYGGVIGNHNEYASLNERHGHVIHHDDSKKASQRSILRIHLHQIELASHQLMSNEENIYHSMRQSYSQYTSIFDNKAIMYLNYRTFALIDAMKHITRKREELDKDDIDSLSLHYRDLMETLPALCELRAAVDVLASTLYQKWRELQDVRRRQGYVSTKAQLIVKKIDHQEDENDAAIERNHKELSSVITLIKHVNKIIDEHDTANADTTAMPAGNTMATNTIDHEKALKLAEDCIAELVRFKGFQPEYLIKLTDTYAITPNTAVAINVSELKRRQQIEGISIKAVLNVNGKAITSATGRVDHPTFIVTYNKTFDLRVFNQPDDVTFDLYRVNTSGTYLLSTEEKIATIAITLPGQDVRTGVSAGRTRSNAFAANKQLVSHLFAPVAGWYSFTNLSMNMQGSALCSCEYDISTSEAHVGAYNGIKDDEYALLPNPPVSSNASSSWGGEQHDVTREKDFQALLPMIHEIDVNDPRSDGIVSMKSKGPKVADTDIFYMSGLHFACPYTEDGGVATLDNCVRYSTNLRLKLLKMRRMQPYLFTEPIPLADTTIKGSEIYRKMLQLEEERNNIDALNQTVASGVDNNDPTVISTLGSQHRVTSFLSKVRSSQTVMMRNIKSKRITTGSAVAETQYFYPLTLDDIENIIPKRKRDLKPVARSRAPLSVQINNCDVLIQVVGARNVPLRNELDDGNRVTSSGTGMSSKMKSRRSIDTTIGSSSSSIDNDVPVLSADAMDGDKIRERRRARTFVEVRFQEHVVFTTSLEGGGPLWKQSMSIPFHAPHNDFSPSNVTLVTDDVTFILFDEVIEDDNHKGGFLEGESTQRTEKRYLGSYSIPFPIVYRETRIEGVFRLNTPLFTFGYSPNETYSTRRVTDEVFESKPEESIEQTQTWSNSMWTFIENLRGRRSRRRNVNDTTGSALIHQDTLAEFDYFITSKSTSYLKVMITLDPVLTTPPDIADEISRYSLAPIDRNYVSFANAWLKELSGLNSHTKERTYKLFASCSNGLQTLLPRFLTPMQPPPGFDTRRSCLHLAAILPFMLDCVSFIGESDLYCTMRETLDMGAGDEEEHATLLYNYLYYISMSEPAERGGRPRIRNKSGYPSEEFIAEESLFLVVGKAIPEGRTLYILLKDKRRKTTINRYSCENYLLINCCSGHVYSAADSNCPLLEIYALVTPYNYFANIQLDDCPQTLSYNILQSDCWRPFFGQRNPYPAGGLLTIQEEITYVPTSPTYALEIEKAVKNAIKNRMRRWRSKRHRSTTTFHPDASSIMQDILVTLEEWMRSGNKSGVSMDNIQNIINEKMKFILRTRTMTGCPLNIPFTDVETVLDQVKSLCYHEANSADVQFVFAVRAFPLYNNLVSLWVFVGTMEVNK